MFTLARILARRSHQDRLITNQVITTDGVSMHAPIRENSEDSLQGRYMAKTSMVLGILMILGGLLSFGLGTWALVARFTMGHIGTGLWVGLLFHCSTGVLGIVAGRIKSMSIQDASRAVNAFLIMCVINLCSGCAAQLLIAVVAAVEDSPRTEYLDSYQYLDDPIERGDATMYAVDVTFIIVSLLEALFCVIGLIIVSIATCCRSYTGYVTQTCITTCPAPPSVTVLNIGGQQQQQPVGYNPPPHPAYQPPQQAQPAVYQPEQPPAYQPPQPPVYQPTQPMAHQPVQAQVHQPDSRLTHHFNVMIPNNRK